MSILSIMNNNKEIKPGKSVGSEMTDSGYYTPLDSSSPGIFVMESKECIKCYEAKPLDQFRVHDNKRRNECICCANIITMNYKKTKNGVVRVIYGNQKEASRNNNLKTISYTSDELLEWCLSQPIYHQLYDGWVKSGYSRWERPSVDRKDDYKGYSFDNIQLMTWRENMDKGFRDRETGKNNKKSRAVLQFTLDGIFIKEYYSIAQAGRDTNVNDVSILKVCKRQRRETAGGYIWKYKNNLK